MRLSVTAFAAMVLQWTTAVHGYPFPESTLMERGIESEILLVESSSTRITVVCLCLFYMLLIVMSQGVRYGRMAGRRSWSNILEVLVLFQCIVCVAFVSTVAILEAGFSMTSRKQCHAAIRFCIAFYAAGKIALYLFFNERIHVLRSPFMSRLRDPIWIIGNIVIMGGFGAVMVYAFVDPTASFNSGTGQCYIGFQDDASICVIVFDTVIGGVLTGIFIKILWPAVRPSIREPSPAVAVEAGSLRRRWLGTKLKRNDGSKSHACKETTSLSSSKRNLRAMLWRTVLGSAAVLANTLINNVIFLTWHHSHRSEVCLLTCLTDIVCGMLVTTWLTMGSIETKHKTPARKCPQHNTTDVTSTTLVSTTDRGSVPPWDECAFTKGDNKNIAPWSDTPPITSAPLSIRSLGVIPEPDEVDFSYLNLQ